MSLNSADRFLAAVSGDLKLQPELLPLATNGTAVRERGERHGLEFSAEDLAAGPRGHSELSLAASCETPGAFDAYRGNK